MKNALMFIESFTATYSCGRALVRDKCSQKYNTSSAEEYLSAEKFRRQHPALSSRNDNSFEDVFTTKQSHQSAAVVNNQSKISDADTLPKKGRKTNFVSVIQMI